jgi:hypothetical protein
MKMSASSRVGKMTSGSVYRPTHKSWRTEAHPSADRDASAIGDGGDLISATLRPVDGSEQVAGYPPDKATLSKSKESWHWFLALIGAVRDGSLCDGARPF